MKVRVAAAKTLVEVLERGRSLASLIPKYAEQVKANERALYQELSYGALRYFHRLDAMLQGLMDKPLKAKDRDVYGLLVVGLYQLEYMRIPSHAAVMETVSAAQALKKPWAKGLLNGVLRNYQRNLDALQAQADETYVGKYSHPDWLIHRLQQAWPEQWADVLEANNQYPPMTLRVNPKHHTRDQYLALLHDAGIEANVVEHLDHAITLKQPVDVLQLPGFAEGWVSVQDGAAQISASLLSLAPGQRVLDACAAPGGKSCHILESEPGLDELVAIDCEQERLLRVEENLARLGLQATLKCGDAAQTEQWWDGKPFDRILLDAPCSATGVIRRHPDIKLLRQDNDIDELVLQQQRLLKALWPLLKPGGVMLYATCSVLPAENSAQVSRFLAETGDARERVVEAGWGRACQAGRQILPGELGMDGFYYAVLERMGTE